MVKTYICPSASICGVYKLSKEKKLDPIKENGGNYFCIAVEKLNSLRLDKIADSVSNSPAECALIEILNKTNTL